MKCPSEEPLQYRRRAANEVRLKWRALRQSVHWQVEDVTPVSSPAEKSRETSKEEGQ